MSAADAMRPVSCTDPHYQTGLMERVRLVPCERCGAEMDAPCVGAYGRAVKYCHAVRHDDAKIAGVLMGVFRRDTEAKLRHVRQVHYELLTIVEGRYR